MLSEARRFNVANAGRRSGKTWLGMHCLIDAALQGQPVAWCSPTYKMLLPVWDEVRGLTLPVHRPDEPPDKQQKRIKLTTGGLIEMWSLDNPDALRGREYGVVVIDEAAMLPELQAVWNTVIRPTLTRHKGTVWFCSTPRGFNDFHSLWARGQDANAGDWRSWSHPTSANPYIDPAELELARDETPLAQFQQEYLAQFVLLAGSVFGNVQSCATAMPSEPEPGRDYVVGVDWASGRGKDYTVMMVLDAERKALVEMVRYNRADYGQQVERLRALVERWQPTIVLAEENSMGGPLIHQLREANIAIRAFQTTQKSKDELIRRLQMGFERSDIAVFADPVLIAELSAYEMRVTPGGLFSYSAPPGGHDDCVMALGLAYYYLARQREVLR